MKQETLTTESSDNLTSSRMRCIEFLVSILRSDLTEDEMKRPTLILWRLA